MDLALNGILYKKKKKDLALNGISTKVDMP